MCFAKYTACSHHCSINLAWAMILGLGRGKKEASGGLVRREIHLMINWFVCSVKNRLFIGAVSIVLHDAFMILASSLMAGSISSWIGLDPSEPPACCGGGR